MESSTKNHTELWEGNEYAKNSNFQQGMAEEILKRCPLKSTDNVLDIGCGDGKLAFKISQICKNGKVFGMDPSESMLKHAQTVHQAENLCFFKGLAEKFEFPGGDVKFDYIISCAALHWSKDLKACLMNFQKLLKPTGKICLVASTTAPRGPFVFAPFVQSIEVMAKQEAWKQHLARYRLSNAYFPHSYEDYLALAKIESPETSTTSGIFMLRDFFLLPREVSLRCWDFKWDNVDGFINWTKQWRPDIQFIPAELQEAYLQEHAALYKEMNKENNRLLGVDEDAIQGSSYWIIVQYDNLVHQK